MMYTRSYQDEGYPLPDGYGGTMLDQHESIRETPEIPDGERTVEASSSPLSWLSGLGGGALGSLFKAPLFKNFKLGTEELLIGAVALFMLFSKDGDKECAIMLLLLLFVT